MADIVVAPEPVHALVPFDFDDPDATAWADARIFGYYDARDLTEELAKFAGGRRYRLADGRVVTVTRQWCNIDPPFDGLSKWLMSLYLVDDKPPATAFVADLSTAELLAVHVRPEQRGEPGWHDVTAEKAPSPIERMRSVFVDKMNQPGAIIRVSDAAEPAADALPARVTPEAVMSRAAPAKRERADAPGSEPPCKVPRLE
jgi:hypothetical protein